MAGVDVRQLAARRGSTRAQHSVTNRLASKSRIPSLTRSTTADRLEAVDVGRAEGRLDHAGHHRRRGPVADHVGDQQGDRAVAGLDVVVDVAGELGAGQVAGGDRQARQLQLRAAAAG